MNSMQAASSGTAGRMVRAGLDALPSWFAAAVPKLLFGLRLWAAVCLSLYLAFWLKLDNAYWAGATAAVVCQPSLGASLRKSQFRLLGTAIGAVAVVVLAGCFAQSRLGFLGGLALWGAACGFVATVLRDHASYGAALAGFTAAIVASSALGATGGVTSDVFTIAVWRSSEICIGIVSAGVVLAGTSVGGARQRLAAELAILAHEIGAGFIDGFATAGSGQASARPVRHRLVARVVGLSSLLEEAIGEDYHLLHELPAVRAAADGLVAALSGWRTVANCLERLPEDLGRAEAARVRQLLPQELAGGTGPDGLAFWLHAPSQLRSTLRHATRALVRFQADTPSLRLLADGAAEALLGFARALDTLAFLDDPRHVFRRQPGMRVRIPDLLPAFINAARVSLTIGAVELFWVVTAWPSGATAVAFAAFGVILFSPREEQAYAITKGFAIGGSFGVVLAGLLKFGVLPDCTDFASFCAALALVLVPLGALSAQSWRGPMFTAVAVFFAINLGAENVMSYDTSAYYNTALATIGGLGAATIAMLLLPPLSAAERARRAIALTLSQVRRLAAGRLRLRLADWEDRVYRRLAGLSAQVDPLRMAQLVAALSMGTEIIRLRRLARPCGLGITDFEPAFDAIARGESAVASARLAEIDRQLAAETGRGQRAAAALRVRGNIRMIRATLALHGSQFDSEDLR